MWKSANSSYLDLHARYASFLCAISWRFLPIPDLQKRGDQFSGADAEDEFSLFRSGTLGISADADGLALLGGKISAHPVQGVVAGNADGLFSFIGCLITGLRVFQLNGVGGNGHDHGGLHLAAVKVEAVSRRDGFLYIGVEKGAGGKYKG